MARLLLLNGPNLNLLGARERAVYGTTTLAQIESRCVELARAAEHTLLAFQSNSELALIERVHAAKSDGTALILINPGAFTHTSVALRDALTGVAIPFIEIHLSNVHAREAFRRHSYFTDRALGLIAGFGAQGYDLALQVAFARLAPPETDDGIQTGI